MDFDMTFLGRNLLNVQVIITCIYKKKKLKKILDKR